MTTAIAIDWDAVTVTAAAKNTKKPADNLRLIQVPRESVERTFAGGDWATWVALESATVVGTDGLLALIGTSMDRPEANTAFMRCGEPGEISLRGRVLLFRQGW